ncbi:MAG TPA: hypothetical protein VED01_09255 [Burkholderiales bacterium]|nr:hypothetical protein [Burkholderiales bacterium]
MDLNIRYLGKNGRIASLASDRPDVVVLDLDEFVPPEGHHHFILGEFAQRFLGRETSTNKGLDDLSRCIDSLREAVEARTGQLGPSVVVIGGRRLQGDAQQKIANAGGTYWAKPDNATLSSEADKVRFVKSRINERLGPQWDTADKLAPRVELPDTSSYIAQAQGEAEHTDDEPPVELSSDDFDDLLESTRLPAGSWKRND